jgi:hypothetical protein
MRIVNILGVTTVGLLVMTQYAMSQRGGAARSGVRGAAVGQMVGGTEGAEKGAKIGVVTGATRTAMDRETTARTQYQATPAYQTAPRSNFTEVPPDVLGVGEASTPAKSGQETVIRKDDVLLVGITFPADWKPSMGDKHISAVSGDGQAYAMLATLGADDREAGIKQVKTGLERYLKDIKFDEQAETKGGATMVTGTGKGKKTGVEVVFATAVFEAAKGQLVGAAFIVDSKIEDHYKETVRGICQTLRRAEDFKK